MLLSVTIDHPIQPDPGRGPQTATEAEYNMLTMLSKYPWPKQVQLRIYSRRVVRGSTACFVLLHSIKSVNVIWILLACHTYTRLIAYGTSAVAIPLAPPHSLLTKIYVYSSVL